MNRAFIQITIHSASIKYNVFNCVKSAQKCATAQRVRKFTHFSLSLYSYG